jgi:hypothetical protein
MTATATIPAGTGPCDICAIIDRDGWNSTGWIHCRVCHKRWKGENKQHCNVCHETFSTPGAADLHWTKRGHISPSLVSKLTFNPERGCWQHAGDRPDYWRGLRGSDETTLSGRETAQNPENAA